MAHRTTLDAERWAKAVMGWKKIVASNDERECGRLAQFGEITIRIGWRVVFPVDTHGEEITRKLESIVLGL